MTVEVMITISSSLLNEMQAHKIKDRKSKTLVDRWQAADGNASGPLVAAIDGPTVRPLAARKW